MKRVYFEVWGTSVASSSSTLTGFEVSYGDVLSHPLGR